MAPYNTRNRQSNRRPLPPGKAIRYTHSPFELKVDDKTKLRGQEDGKVVITQDADDGTFDEVILPASAFFKTVDMLNLTRSSEIVDRDEIKRK